MAYYDKKNHRFVDTAPHHYPSTRRRWLSIDCGCCAGTQWGGDEPRECSRCGGDGGLALHVKSGMLAQWPGGPAAGHLSREEARALVALIPAKRRLQLPRAATPTTTP